MGPLHLLATFAVFAAASSGLLKRKGCHCHCQDKSVYSGKDFISQLSDDILSIILSHLNMREAARTKLISRRWMYVYSSASCLDFSLVTMFGPIQHKDHICQRYVHKFVEAVNAYLKGYRGSAITSIKFSCCLERMFAADIDEWLSFAVSMGVRELELRCSCKKAAASRNWYNRDHFYVFSFKLIANTSKLKQLRLVSCTIRRDFNGQFHSLCILDLSFLLLSQTDVQYILLTCLNLEQLRLCACILPTNFSICGPLLRLKVLTLDTCHNSSTVEKLKFELSASSLITFEHFYTVRPSFSGVPCLKNLFSDMRKDNVAYLYGGLARDVPQLESLSLFCPSEYEVPYFPRCCNTMSNLKHLALYFSIGVQYDLLYIILPFLKACPLLEKFHLMLMWYPVDKMKPLDVLEKHDLTALKEVEFGGFYGSENQIQLVTYLIENAVSLERLVLSTGYRYYWGFGKFTYHEGETKMDEVKRGRILDQLERKALSSGAQVKIQLNKFPERK